MFKKERTVNFNKSGSGSYTPRLSLPINWVRELGITKEDNKVSLEFEGDKIIIKKL